MVAKGQLGGAAPSQKAPVVTGEQMELARLRAENARLKVERDTAEKAAAYFAQDVLQSTLRNSANEQQSLACEPDARGAGGKQQRVFQLEAWPG